MAEIITHAHAPSTLGQVWTAWTAAGLCALLIEDDPKVALAELTRRFPGADLRAGGDARPLAEIVDHPARAYDGPLDLRGTPFQRAVWLALMAIPAGETATYRSIAHSLGRPKAVRAVGTACGANHVSVIVPCHRALRSDGGMGGYYWGLERKRRLLEMERRP